MNTISDQPLFAPAPEWTGRADGLGPEHARWHSVIQPLPADGAASARDAAVLVGYASDEGVLRNGGRQGAAAGPAALRSALGGLAVHDSSPRFDAGTVTTQRDDLEGSQEELSRRVADIVGSGNLAVVLGGGHETAFATHRGAFRGNGEQPLKIVNLDAHFDLRTADRATSGTPFKQIAGFVQDACPEQPAAFDYSVFGISEANNTAVLFNTADELGVETVLDEDLVDLSPSQAAGLVAKSVQNQPAIHLSIDLDVLPAAAAPGVSAPAALGVDFAKIRAMALAVAATGKLRLVDVVELNPDFDVDGRTAKLAARLIADIVAAHASAHA
ncbi:formimidoylglutamase [Corynebacterium sp. LK2522]|uniref:formimidoylglutamase n=1 Tax=Corynebacterium sp. LK2522 TaxID=3110474 RepID=UPI0034CEC4BE